jgi:molybdopterin molybdotransferase
MHCVGDTLDSLRESLNTAAEDCDLILTSGGVSMGEWDLVRKIMEDEGDVHFWRVKLRPGSPPLFGLWKDTPIFGLPGNPVSSHVVFRILVGPWIRNATSATGPIEVRAFAKLATTVKPTKDSLTLRRVTIETTEEGLVAHQKIHQGSGNLASIAYSEGMAVLQPEREYSIGDMVEVMII